MRDIGAENGIAALRMKDIREHLAIDTTGLGLADLAILQRLTSLLNERLCCELWGAKMGWRIPPYGTVEWQELQSAWLTHEDEE